MSKPEEEYPKSLYKSGWDDLNDTVVVHDKGEEAAARKEGFKHLDEFAKDAEAK